MDTSKFHHHDSGNYQRFCGPAQIEKDLNTLHGYIIGIEADGKITKEEVEKLTDWVDSVGKYSKFFPYKVFIGKINEIVADGIVTSDEAQDLLWLCNQYLNNSSPYYNVITSSIQRLTGFLSGIAADGVIHTDELLILQDWVNENRFLSGTWPFDRLLDIIDRTTLDGNISPSVYDELLSFCETISAIPSTKDNNKNLVQSIENSVAEILIPESSFCITGESKRYTRQKLAEIVELYGGFIQNSVSGKLHYLVVCDEKNSCWAFASYGRKVEKAIQLKEKGAKLSVIYEEDLYTSLQKLGFNH